MPVEFVGNSFDSDNLRSTSKSYISKFWLLTQYPSISKDGVVKLYIHNANLVADERYLQGVRRWYNGDSRIALYKYLQEELGKYILFLQTINVALQTDRFNTVYQHVRDQNIDLCKAVAPGLRCLMKLYPEFEMLNSCLENAATKMDSYILRYRAQDVPLMWHSQLYADKTNSDFK